MFEIPYDVLSEKDQEWLETYAATIAIVADEVREELREKREQAARERELEDSPASAFRQVGEPSPHPMGESPFKITATGILGDQQDDNIINAAAIQSDGAVLLGGVIGESPALQQVTDLGRVERDARGILLRLTGDGKEILQASRLADFISQIAVDDQDQIYVAAGEDGVFVLDPTGTEILRHHDNVGWAHRTSVSPNGYYVSLAPNSDRIGRRETTPRAGTMYLFDPSGEKLSEFRGHRHTLDLAIHEPSQTVVHTGWRQANSWQPDGGHVLPVQIAYLRGVGFDGEVKWTGYDWSTTKGEDDFLNNGDNNMADTRGYRMTLGRDGLLYVGYEVAGGNHIFRYSPFDIRDRVSDRHQGGDHYHAMHRTRSEHKTFIGIYEPDTGEFLSGQEFTARLDDGTGNAWRMTRGSLAAAENGLLLFAGASAAHSPMTFKPATSNPNYRGGATLHGMKHELGSRVFGTYFNEGSLRSVAARTISGQDDPMIVVTGKHRLPEDPDEDFYLHHYPLQSELGGGSHTGIYLIMNGVGGQTGGAPGETANFPGRTWTSTDGREIEAQMIRLEGDQVRVLRKDNNQPINIPLDMLSEECQAYVRENSQ
ncbi:MAG: hypothetical protein JJT75_05790 [Opitutales bacterium]|nr:hypothetical protein [Opitutales bacterium]